MLVSHRHQFIYTKTHKTAGTSVEGYFERFCLPPNQEFQLQHHRNAYESEHGIVGFRGEMHSGEKPKWWSHMSAFQIQRQLGDEIWSRYFKFCVVRNPYEMVVSAYFFAMRQNGKPDLELFALPLGSLKERFGNWLNNAKLPDDRERFMINGAISMDDFIKYENLTADVERICGRLSIDYCPDLFPSFKREYRPAQATAEALHTLQTQEIVEKAYAFELDYFGYGFPKKKVVKAVGGLAENTVSASKEHHSYKIMEENSRSPTGLSHEQVVRQIYQELLGREADPGGLEHYSRVVAEPYGVATCLRAMIGSTEFAHRARASKQDIKFRKEDLEQEKIVFLHLPKTGGTTLHQLLSQGRSTDEICPERHNGLHAFAAGELARYRLFSGHFDHVSTDLIPGRKARITMFRHPVDRLISLYHFQKAHREEVIERDGLHLARLANAHSMADFFGLEEVRNHPSINNAMTRMLSERLDSLRWEAASNHSNALPAPNLEQAFESLRGMRAFGLMERYEDSVKWIFASLGLAIPDQIPRRMAHDTIIEEDPCLRKIIKEPLTNEVQMLLEEMVATDMKLYDRANQLFRKKIK